MGRIKEQLTMTGLWYDIKEAIEDDKVESITLSLKNGSVYNIDKDDIVCVNNIKLQYVKVARGHIFTYIILVDEIAKVTIMKEYDNIH